MLRKQAKILTDQQIKVVLAYLDSTSRNTLRNKVIFLLSLHGLRAKEIANLEVSMITNAEGELAEAIALQDKAAKGKSGRIVPINQMLRDSLKQYLLERKHKDSLYVITTERAQKFSSNAVAILFKKLYSSLGFEGCSSHSGRRTMITKAARKASQAGGSLRDVMVLAGHKNLQTTQQYVEQDSDAQRKLVAILYSF